jgi:hypothetical protein
MVTVVVRPPPGPVVVEPLGLGAGVCDGRGGGGGVYTGTSAPLLGQTVIVAPRGARDGPKYATVPGSREEAHDAPPASCCILKPAADSRAFAAASSSPAMSGTSEPDAVDGHDQL